MENKVKSRKTGRYISKKLSQRHAKAVAAMNQAKKDIRGEIQEIQKPAEGIRMVEYKELGKNLRCCECKETLSLENITKEKFIGAHSIITVRCDKCNVLTKVHSATFDNNLSRVNTSLVLGAIHSGVGHTSLNKILACTDSPNINNEIYKRYEKLVGDAIEEEAKRSCKQAAVEERNLVISKIKELCQEL